MEDETEIGWMTLADGSELALTSSYVVQQADRGIFGANRVIMRRTAITSVRAGWQRSRGLLAAGAALLLVYGLVTLGSIVAAPDRWPEAASLLSSAAPVVAAIQYGALAGGIGFLVLFWLDRQVGIEIRTANGTLGGAARNYEEAQAFCALLMPALAPGSTSARKAEDPFKPSRESADQDWRL